MKCSVELSQSFWDLPCWVKHSLVWIHDQQTLVTGLLALAAAYFTIRQVRAQIAMTKSFRDDEIERKNIAMRSGMPVALSNISNYSEHCIRHAHGLFIQFNTNISVRPYTPTVPCPEYPQESFDKIQLVIESADPDTARALSEFISTSQVQRSRISDLLPSLNNLGGRNVLINNESFYSQIYDALFLNKFTDRIYEYARLERSNLEELCDGNAAARKLRFLVLNNNEDLADLIVRRWPTS